MQDVKLVLPGHTQEEFTTSTTLSMLKFEENLDLVLRVACVGPRTVPCVFYVWTAHGFLLFV